jgi:low temperature requirement protein LtrA
MFQTILVFSPLMVLFLLSLISLVFGLRNYRLRREKRSIDPNKRSVTFITFGAIGLATSGSIFLFALTLSRIIFLCMFFGGIILFLVGGVTLRKLVIARKEYVFSLSASIVGMTLIVLNFPLAINIHEPFTVLYAFCIVIAITIQIVVLETWKKKRKYEPYMPIDEKLVK